VPAWAYEFRCDRSLYEMAPLFNQAGPWTWGVRDCAFYPDYLECRPGGGLRACVYEVNPPGGPAYRSYVEVRGTAGVDRATVDPVFLKLLGTLPVRGLAEIPADEWPFD